MEIWTEEREDKLVEMWEQRPVLYNCASKSYSDRNARTKALEEIAEAVGTTVSEVQKRIATLRTQYTRHTKQPPSGSEWRKKTKRQEWVIRMLAFLAPYVKKRTSVSNFENNNSERWLDEVEGSVENDQQADTFTEESLTDDADASDFIRDDTVEGSESNEASPSTSPEVPTVSTKRPLPSKIAGKKRKSTKKADDEELLVLKNVAQSLTDLNKAPTNTVSGPEDELDVFGKHIVRKLRHIKDGRTLLIVQNQIEQLCFQGQMGSLPDGSQSFIRYPSSEGFYGFQGQSNQNSSKIFQSNLQLPPQDHTKQTEVTFQESELLTEQT
ncbi:hypothetical protein HOLleu_11141 [Holothuria leucospilota]|uniref:MADF domain-containing protein n=1 Tax=Holothuria leucospilota TaxID=206669 RepID=A0A9Q1HC54_HOLLE|nr:hypothetical protein HOLleu_11141 [Holothuria leucospilota]